MLPFTSQLSTEGFETMRVLVVPLAYHGYYVISSGSSVVSHMASTAEVIGSELAAEPMTHWSKW